VCQASERLADARAAHAEDDGEAFLGELGAGAEPMLEHGVVDLPVDVVDLW
jgi:hypothetical protein